VKPKLLVVELWGLGDLIIATPFLQAASQSYEVTLLAKPYAVELQKRFWPQVRVVPFTAPWTAFKYINKYRLWAWPWKEVSRLLNGLAAARFDFGLSARWDPRDHLLLRLAKAKTRLGFPRLGSGISLARRLARPEPQAHRYENWRVIARELGFDVPARDALRLPQLRPTARCWCTPARASRCASGPWNVTAGW
jgi:ADP-heptose:LPS heptosyltransferase